MMNNNQYGAPNNGMGGPGYGQPGGNNNAMAMNPNQAQPTFSLQQMLMSASGIYVKQKFEFFEAVTGCETANKYYVYERAPNGKKFGKKWLKCKENSGCCARNCLPGDCRPIQMNVTNLWFGDKVSLELLKECKCTCLCFNRPSMKVTFTENGNPTYFGKVVDNFDCCNYSFSVKDENHKTIYHIEADCCQCGICCNFPCEKCEKVIFNIWSGDKEKKLSAPLMKVGKKSCIKNALGDADNFSVPFPAEAGFKERALLLAASLLIDYRMFEESQNGNEGRNRH